MKLKNLGTADALNMHIRSSKLSNVQKGPYHIPFSKAPSLDEPLQLPGLERSADAHMSPLLSAGSIRQVCPALDKGTYITNEASLAESPCMLKARRPTVEAPLSVASNVSGSLEPPKTT